METHLTIKHLAGYLPYGLKILSHENEIQVLTGIRDETYFIEKGNVYAYGDIQDCNPILRPLSDLAKEIEVNGEKFVPVEKIQIYDLNNINYFTHQIKNGFVEVIVFNMLLEWHFDIYGLIEAGLAIDVNALKE